MHSPPDGWATYRCSFAPKKKKLWIMNVVDFAWTWKGICEARNHAYPLITLLFLSRRVYSEWYSNSISYILDNLIILYELPLVFWNWIHFAWINAAEENTNKNWIAIGNGYAILDSTRVLYMFWEIEKRTIAALTRFASRKLIPFDKSITTRDKSHRNRDCSGQCSLERWYMNAHCPRYLSYKRSRRQGSFSTGPTLKPYSIIKRALSPSVINKHIALKIVILLCYFS